jgi:ribosomal protein S18 acetylase RimI-like enzyme
MRSRTCGKSAAWACCPGIAAAISQHLLEAVIHHGLAAGVQEVRLAVRADQPKLIDFYTAYEFELAEELEYSTPIH